MRYKQRFYQPYLKLDKYADVKKIVDEQFKYCKKEKLRKHILLYAVNFLISNNGRLSVSRSQKWFHKNIKVNWHTITHSTQALKELENQGLIIKVQEGKRGIGGKSGISTVYKRTSKFKEIFSKDDKMIQIDDLEIDTLGLGDVSIDEKGYTWDKDKLSKTKLLDGRDMRLDDNDFVILVPDSVPVPIRENYFEETIQTVNWLNKTYFSKIKLGFSKEGIGRSMIKNVYLTRIYGKNEEDETEDCGRFYQKYSRSYQNIEKEEVRKYLTINGQKTTEIDYSSMFTNLLYVREGKQLTQDPYEQVVKELIGDNTDQGTIKEVRKIVKLCVNVLYNSKSLKSYVSTFNSKKNKRHYELRQLLKDKYGKGVNDIRKVMEKVHPDIKQYFYTGIGKELMFTESNIIQEVLLRMEQENILGLPLHDSIICQEDKGLEVFRIMKDVYKDYIKKQFNKEFEIELKIEGWEKLIKL